MDELEPEDEPGASSRALVLHSHTDSLEERFGNIILGGIVGSTVVLPKIWRIFGGKSWVDLSRHEEGGKRGGCEMKMSTQIGEEDVVWFEALSDVDMAHVDMSNVNMSDVDMLGNPMQK